MSFLPVAQVLPVHPVRQEHLLGAVQVPPFRQAELHTAEMYIFSIMQYMMSFLPVAQVLPVHPVRQEHLLGAVQVPPFAQPGLHTAEVLYIFFTSKCS